MIETAIFDLDGTLVDTQEANARAYAEACKLAGVNVSPADYAAAAGLGGSDLIAQITGLTDPALIAAIHRRKIEIYPDYLDYARVNQAVAGLARRLAGQMPICLATSAARASVLQVLARFELMDLFTIIITRDDVTHPKPHPEPFLACLAALGGIAPAAALVIEDSPIGAEAARRAGIACLLVAS